MNRVILIELRYDDREEYIYARMEGHNYMDKFIIRNGKLVLLSEEDNESKFSVPFTGNTIDELKEAITGLFDSKPPMVESIDFQRSRLNKNYRDILAKFDDGSTVVVQQVINKKDTLKTNYAIKLDGNNAFEFETELNDRVKEEMEDLRGCKDFVTKCYWEANRKLGDVKPKHTFTTLSKGNIQ